MNWEKTGRTVLGNGESTVSYRSGRYTIETRKRLHPHSGREGYWMYTSYFLIVDGHETEYHSLRDAKEAAERMDA